MFRMCFFSTINTSVPALLTCSRPVLLQFRLVQQSTGPQPKLTRQPVSRRISSRGESAKAARFVQQPAQVNKFVSFSEKKSRKKNSQEFYKVFKIFYGIVTPYLNPSPQFTPILPHSLFFGTFCPPNSTTYNYPDLIFLTRILTVTHHTWDCGQLLTPQLPQLCTNIRALITIP